MVVALSLSLSPENSGLYLFYFADFVCCEDLDSNNFCFVLKMRSSLPQLFVFLFDVWSVAVFVIRDRFVKNTNKNSRLVRESLSLCNKVLSYLISLPFEFDLLGTEPYWFVLY